MTKDKKYELIKKLFDLLKPRPIFVDSRVDNHEQGDLDNTSDYFSIIIELIYGSLLLGFFKSNYEPDIDVILEEVAHLESLREPEAIYLMAGSHIVSIDTIENYGYQRDMFSEIYLSPSIIKIQNAAFFSCSNLKSIDIPEGVKEIGDSAFANCCSLENVVLPQSLKRIGEKAFDYCKNLRRINIPQRIEDIGNNPFKACSIKELTFENEQYLFENGLIINRADKEVIGIYNSDIQNIKIPEYVIRIGREAFYNCKSLQKVELPQSLSSIGEEAFYGCIALNSVTIPKSVVKISEYSFLGCHSLQSVNIPEGVAEIGKKAFVSCISLKILKLPKSIEKIGSNAFQYCRSLSEVTVNNPNILQNNTGWDNSAFDNCENLTSVNLPKGLSWSKVKNKFKGTPYGKENPNPSNAKAKRERIEKMNAVTIEMLAKAATGDLEASVELKDTKIIIRANLINGAALYAEITKEKNAKATEINFEQVKAAVQDVVPDTLVFIGCTKITHEMLDAHKDFTSIVFPETLTEIDYKAFAECASLKSLVIPEGVTKIGWEAFSNCSSLENVTLPESLTKLNRNLFKGCTALNKITFNNPQTIKSIEPETFLGCNLKDLTFENDNWVLKDGLVINKEEKEIIGTYRNDLENVIIPDWITKIGMRAFASNQTLKSIVLPWSTSEIGYNAFEGCSSLKSITIPPCVTTIEKETFLDCISLEKVFISNNVREIGKSAFSNCSSLKKINIPCDVTTIGEKAFFGCKSLQSVNLPERLTNLGGHAFSDCYALKNITLPKGLFEIEYHTFYKCSSLEKVHIPESVTRIGLLAFSECKSLKEINLPDGIKEIEIGAFEGCTSLKSVSLPKYLKDILEKTFYNSGLTTITLPPYLHSIGEKAFADCYYLSEVNILGYIPYRDWNYSAFAGCTAITMVNLPDYLTWEDVRGKFRDSPYGQKKPDK